MKQLIITNFNTETITLKKCTKCSKLKPATAEYYYRNKNIKDGLQYQCKKCQREYHKKYLQTEKGRETNRKSVRKYDQSEKGKEVSRKAQRKYRQTEKGKEVNRKAQRKHYKKKKQEAGK